MSGNERMNTCEKAANERVNLWAKAAYEIQTAILKTCPNCSEPTMKVPNTILCSATGELVKEVKSK